MNRFVAAQRPDRVYCLERQFENPAAFPFGEEYDAWDVHTAQFVVRQRSSGTWVAAMRLVLPEAARFPVETLRCLTPEHANRLRRRELAGISRICVINSPDPHPINRHLDRSFGHVARNGESEVLLGMIRTIVLYGLERGIEHCYLLVTDAFARLLRRLGVVLHPAGTATDPRGIRTPHRVRLRESAVSPCNRSAAVQNLFACKALAYKPFSALDDETDATFEPMPRFPPPFAADVFPRADIARSRPGPGIWRLQTERTQPGPGVRRGAS